VGAKPGTAVKEPEKFASYNFIFFRLCSLLCLRLVTDLSQAQDAAGRRRESEVLGSCGLSNGLNLWLAIGAIAADFSARNGDLNLAVVFNLLLELLEQATFHFPYLPATQTGYVDVIAQAVAFVIVLIAADVKQVEFVNQADALEHVQCAVDGDAVNAGIDFLGAIEDCSGV
jgi:hypothetical protein